MEGQKLSAPEIEAALRAHPDVVDAAVVGVARGAGEAVYAFVLLEPDANANDVLQADLKGWVRREVGPSAVPQVVQFAPGLPKTEAGELVRPILRRIAEGDEKAAGETAGLADPSVVEALLKSRATAEA
ncbi:AMP-binding enzyme [Phenylobacterium sp.]|uniref:AMP-binding enzyme n=1 Tax=Phenylobacterium sp. TaxID=1871053 RepID=UPI002F943E15